MLHSYTGYILVVDMTTGQIEKQALNEAYARQYIGGRDLVQDTFMTCLNRE